MRTRPSRLAITATIIALSAGTVVGLASAHASDCTQRLTVSVDGAYQPAPCSARIADAFGDQVARSYLSSGLTLAGQVFTASGAPAAGAPVSVVSASLGGSNPAIIKSGRTNAQGRYRFRVSRGSSRLLTVWNGWGGSLMVRELVSPDVSLWVHAHSGARLVLGGRVLTDTSANPTVVLQDLAPTGWQTFGVAAPNSWGAYQYVYRSDPSTVGHRYAIRATTMPTSAWQPGVSGVHEATVR
jgi:hypothetical protein